MKQKKIEQKLVLKKQSIAFLTKTQIELVKGGSEVRSCVSSADDFAGCPTDSPPSTCTIKTITANTFDI